jgi:hypothetical protein
MLELRLHEDRMCNIIHQQNIFSRTYLGKRTKNPKAEATRHLMAGVAEAGGSSPTQQNFKGG